MGALLVFLSAFGFSTLGIFGKFAYLEGFTRNQMLFFRFLLSLPVIAVVLVAARALPRDPRTYGRAVLLGAVGIGVEASLYFMTLEKVGAALTGVFLYLYPSAVAVLSRVVLKQRLSPARWACVALSLVGVILAVDPFGGPTLTAAGLAAGIGTGVWYAIYLLAGDRLTHDQNPLTVSSGILLGACLCFGLFTLYEYLASPVSAAYIAYPSRLSHWWPLLGLALVAGVLPFTTLYAGMKRVGATQASVLSTSEVVFTIVLAALFLDEKLTAVQIAGSAIVLGSVIAIQRFR